MQKFIGHYYERHENRWKYNLWIFITNYSPEEGVDQQIKIQYIVRTLRTNSG